MLWIPIAFDYLRKMSVWHHLVSWLNWRKPFVLGTKDRSSVIHIKKKTPPQKEGKKNPGKAYWWKGHLNTHLGSIFSIDWFQLKFMRQWDFVSKTQNPRIGDPRLILLIYLMNISYQHNAIFLAKKTNLFMFKEHFKFFCFNCIVSILLQLYCTCNELLTELSGSMLSIMAEVSRSSGLPSGELSKCTKATGSPVRDTNRTTTIRRTWIPWYTSTTDTFWTLSTTSVYESSAYLTGHKMWWLFAYCNGG